MQHEEHTIEEGQQTPAPDPHQNETQVMPDPLKEPESHRSMTPIIIGAIVVLLAILGGLYYWGTMMKGGMDDGPTPEEIMNEPDQQAQELGQVSNSDDVSDIERDLDTTDLDSIDSDLSSIEADLEAEMSAEAR